MKSASLIVLSGLLALPVGAALVAAQPAIAAPADTVAEGTIKSVDKTAMSFILTGADGKDTTVKVTKDTKYMLDGVASTMEKVLVVGNKAKATHAMGTASKVEATTVKKP